ncbi:MAG: hypothetical protein ACI9S8_002550 [Chlamydiales bacterium]|jgi:hypothetical protein
MVRNLDSSDPSKGGAIEGGSFLPDIGKSRFKKSTELVSRILSIVPELSSREEVLKSKPASLKNRVVKIPAMSLGNRNLDKLFTGNVSGAFIEKHCLAGIHSEINGSINSKHRFVLTKGVEKFIYDIRELKEYVESKADDPNWQRPPVELSCEDISLLQQKYNKAEGGNQNKVDFAPLMSRLSGMSPKVSERVNLGKALAKLRKLMKFSGTTTVAEKSFRMQQALEHIETLDERTKFLVLHLRDAQTGQALKAIKAQVDLAKESPVAGSDMGWHRWG